MFSTRIRALVRQQWAGLIALFLVLTGGSAYALDGSNTVFSDDIVNGEVREADVGQGAVTSDEVKNGSITGRDVADNSLKGADIDESTLSSIGGGGPAGGDLTGTYPDPEIAADAVGAAEIADGAITRSKLGPMASVSNRVTIPPGGGVGEVSVHCPNGSLVLNGGALFEFPSGDITASFGGGIGWTAEGQNNGNAEQDLLVAASCLLP